MAYPILAPTRGERNRHGALTLDRLSLSDQTLGYVSLFFLHLDDCTQLTFPLSERVRASLALPFSSISFAFSVGQGSGKMVLELMVSAYSAVPLSKVPYSAEVRTEAVVTVTLPRCSRGRPQPSSHH